LSLDYPRYKVVVVDNGSKDGSVEFVEFHYPNIHLIRNEKNLGDFDVFTKYIVNYIAGQKQD